MTGRDLIATLPERPGAEREEQILQAVRDGHDHVQFTGLSVTFETPDREHVLALSVAEQALALGQTKPVRVAVSARAAQLIADELDCVLLTPRLSDLIYQRADVRLSAHTQRPDSQMAFTSRFVRHSEAIDKQLAGRAGLVAPEGKDWVLCKRLWQAPTRGANYGWHVERGRWHAVSPGLYVLQPLGLAHVLSHTDYSQLLRLVRRSAYLNGKQTDLGELYTSDELWPLVSHEGPLPGDRHPGVAELPDPADQPWRGGSLSLGERALAYSAHEHALGIAERPLGSNAGPAIARYFGPCVRQAADGSEQPLGLTRGNWCAASACAAAFAAEGPDRATVPHEYRAAVVELVEDLVLARAYWPIARVRRGEYTPRLGDLAIFDRSQPGRPETEWWRHVARTSELVGEDRRFKTLGGNEADRYRYTPRDLDSPRLLGFGAYPLAEAAAGEESAARWSEDELGEFRRLSMLSDAVMRGEYGLDAAWADFEDPDYDADVA